MTNPLTTNGSRAVISILAALLIACVLGISKWTIGTAENAEAMVIEHVAEGGHKGIEAKLDMVLSRLTRIEGILDQERK